MKVRLMVLAAALAALISLVISGIGTAGQAMTIDELHFVGDQFPAGSSSGTVVTPAGLTLDSEAMTGVYTSPVLTAPLSFNAVVPQWIADIPDMADFELMLRTARTPGTWSDWYDIHVQPDWMLPTDPDAVGEMVTVPAADITHQYVQISVSLNRYDGSAPPVLSELTLTFIDSTAGPTATELVVRQKALDAVAGGASSGEETTGPTGFPRPTVVSRQVWCTAPECNYVSGLQYQPVTHLLIHHTVSSNSNSDWAAVVRAIWSFHTFTRGWGDIGYNYLVDMNGVLYEGHNSADYLNLDVVGTHAAIANAGGLGLALIGTFATADEYPVTGVPPQPMLDASAKLLAWKADQRNIDVYGASRMVDTPWGLPHLMGHRDVYGGTRTTCPGGNAHNLLPWLRDEVARLIGFESPYLYVDELSSAFTKSNANWYVGPRGCGNNGHTYYTWSITDPAQSTNWGEWRPNVPTSGRYELEVYAPYCDTGKAETDGATYRVTHANGTDTVVISQDNNIGLWTKLGDFDLQSGNHTVVRLSDLTTTDSWLGVWFDAIRLRQLPPTAANGQPTSGSWQKQRQVQFAWTVINPSAVQSTGLQVASDAAFNSLLVERSWPGAVYNYTHGFGQDYADLYWRVLLTSTTGTQVTSLPTRFGLDASSPTSAVFRVNRTYIGDAYALFWSGDDALSGVSSYNIDFRADGSAVWSPLLVGTQSRSTGFAPSDPQQKYWFRSQAIDAAGNVEALHIGAGDRSTDDAIQLPYAIMLPVIWR